MENMSFSRVWSGQIISLKADIISVEVDLSRGLHFFSIIGLSNTLVDEAKDRVSSALKNSNFSSPKHSNEKVIVSLSPPYIKKDGTAFDLAIAIAYLNTKKIIRQPCGTDLFLGELSLDGLVKKTRGILSIVIKAKENGFKNIFIPKDNENEVKYISDINIYSVKNLNEVVRHLNGEKDIIPVQILEYKIEPSTKNSEYLFENIYGLDHAKRGLEIAIAGKHSIALWGRAGIGKTLLAKSSSSIIPPLNLEESIEVTSIHSLLNNTEDLVSRPPFRSPHHSSSYSAIIGGGANITPGEITLAHRGILFMDEFLEFDRRVINSLREPLEEKCINIARASSRASLPADIVLIIAMNPCPCGYHGANIPNKKCVCEPKRIENYRNKLSGPILDRIDMWIEINSTDIEKILPKNDVGTKGSAEIRKSIDVMKDIIRARELICKNKDTELSKDIQEIIKEAVNIMNISTRGIKSIKKLSRTIASLDNSDIIKREHVLEALDYRIKKDF
ncbi:MAG: YifB family Mg chelatase-like AAA ATPase [bacterium]|nr:YifB family Mg chelatase-like AAA ATPase [bacterium]